MTSSQFEELCRYFLAQQLGLTVDQVCSISMPNPRRPGLPGYSHQIDFYWETESAVAQYLTIANAKWRGQRKVDQTEILLLQKVKEKVGAHKAVMITNSEFTNGAVAAAADEHLALLIVRPEFDYASLHATNASLIREQIGEIASRVAGPIYSSQVVQKGLAAGPGARSMPPAVGVDPVSHSAAGPGIAPLPNPSLGADHARYATRHRAGLSFRTK